MKRLALFLAVAMGTIGCQSYDNWRARNTSGDATAESYEDAPVTAPGLQLSPEQRFADVPLPVGVHEDIEKTFVYETSDLQIGRLVYTTRAKVGELVAFYIRECPVSNWELQNVVQADGAELEFTKPGRRLEVKIITPPAIGGSRQLVLTLVPGK